ncbi:MAG: hypothetical protein ACO32Z_03880 [Gemmatimonadaceae bacterium]|jgi:hypothetical protein
MTQRALPILALVALGLGVSLPSGPIEAQVLFRATAPVAITLTTNLRDIVRERDSTALRWFGAEMAWTEEGAAAKPRSMPVELRARGHFRRQARNCSFPPLFLRAEKAAREGTILQGNPRLKVVTPCRPTAPEYQQYILLEYMMYRTYAILHPIHHRARLATLTYKDSTDRVKPITVTAFLLETEEEVADQHKLTSLDQTGALFADFDQTSLDRIALWEFWIGNTDWSVAALHNIELFRDEAGTYFPVAYDFDWSGAVNARYAFPNPMLGIRTVRQRLHRGPCRTAAEWAPTIAHYRAKRAAIDSLWAASVPGLEDKRRDDTKAFLDELWPILDDPKKFDRAVVKECQAKGN